MCDRWKVERFERVRQAQRNQADDGLRQLLFLGRFLFWPVPIFNVSVKSFAEGGLRVSKYSPAGIAQFVTVNLDQVRGQRMCGHAFSLHGAH